MNSATIFDPIPWQAVGIAVLQTSIIFCVVIIGLKMVGRRVFGELAPQDLVLLLLIAEATNAGLTTQDGGFWSTMASVLTVLFLGALSDRLPPLRRFVEEHTIPLMENGKLIEEALKKNLVEEEDLQSLARKYGFPHYNAFETITLECDGSLSGVLKPEYRQARTPVSSELRTEQSGQV